LNIVNKQPLFYIFVLYFYIYLLYFSEKVNKQCYLSHKSEPGY